MYDSKTRQQSRANREARSWREETRVTAQSDDPNREVAARNERRNIPANDVVPSSVAKYVDTIVCNLAGNEWEEW